MIASLLRTFPEDFAAELEGAPPLEPLPVPKIVDIHDGVARLRRAPDAQATRLDVRAGLVIVRSTVTRRLCFTLSLRSIALRGGPHDCCRHHAPA